MDMMPPTRWQMGWPLCHQTLATLAIILNPTPMIDTSLSAICCWKSYWGNTSQSLYYEICHPNLPEVVVVEVTNNKTWQTGPAAVCGQPNNPPWAPVCEECVVSTLIIMCESSLDWCVWKPRCMVTWSPSACEAYFERVDSLFTFCPILTIVEDIIFEHFQT